MSFDDNNSALCGFRLESNRLLKATIADLRISREYSFEYLHEGDEPSSPVLIEKLHGVASLGANSIGCIGENLELCKQLNVTITPFPDWAKLLDKWVEKRDGFGNPLDNIDEIYNDSDGVLLVDYLRYVYRIFDRNPPTVSLYSDNLDCLIPKYIFDAIVKDRLNGHFASLVVYIQFLPTFVKYNINDSITFGRLKYQDGYLGDGWLNSLSWDVTDVNSLVIP